MAYMAMVNGSPYVVPSQEYRVSLSMCNCTSDLYVLVRTGASDGHKLWTLSRAAWRFRILNAFVASTRSTACESLSSKS